MRPAKWLPLISCVTIALLAFVSYSWFAQSTDIAKILVVLCVATVLVAGGPLVVRRKSR